jgi:hypothetical protein
LRHDPKTTRKAPDTVRDAVCYGTEYQTGVHPTACIVKEPP